MIRFSIFFATILLPCLAGYLAYSQPVSYGLLFVVLFICHISARTWETFYTTKECAPQKSQGDWTLSAATFAYVILCLIIILEFFLLPRSRTVQAFISGGIFYALATRFRWWGQLTLGKQWAIHVIGEDKTNIKKAHLLQIGPYGYIRHPIYLGIILDIIALPLLAGTPMAFIFALVINIPLQSIRLLIEEKKSLAKFTSYGEYKEKTCLILPLKSPVSFIKKIFLN